MYKRNQFFNKVFSLSLLVSPFAIQANINPNVFSNQTNKSQNIGQTGNATENNKDHWRSVLRNKQVEIKEKFLDEEKTLYELAIDTSSEEIKEVVQNIKNSKEDNPNILLLMGKPGVGKTILGPAIASQTGRTCYMVKCSKLLTIYQNSGKQNLSELANAILQLHPTDSSEGCVIVLDEIDQLAPTNENDDNTNKTSSKALLDFFDDCLENPNILIVGTSNTKEEYLHPALIDRCRGDDGVITIKTPSEEKRKEIIKYLQSIQTTTCPIEKDDKYIEELVEKTKNKSIRRINESFKKATKFAKRRSKKAKCDCKVTMEDFKKALAEFQKKEDSTENTLTLVGNHTLSGVKTVAKTVSLAYTAGMAGCVAKDHYDTYKDSKADKPDNSQSDPSKSESETSPTIETNNSKDKETIASDVNDNKASTNSPSAGGGGPTLYGSGKMGELRRALRDVQPLDPTGGWILVGVLATASAGYGAYKLGKYCFGSSDKKDEKEKKQ